MIYIISYPRSGNTAFRYIIELITRKPTNGLCGVPNKKDNLQQPLSHKRNDFVAHKRHDFKGVTQDDFVFFIIRHPLEAVIRHNEAKRGLDFEKMKGYLDSYMDLLRIFNAHGNGMAIYYEELTTIAFKESKQIYRDPQSTSHDYHRQKISKLERKLLMEYISLNPLYKKYLSHYDV